MSVYTVYGSQNEFVERVTRVSILRMRSLGQSRPLRQNAVFAVDPICKGSNSGHCFRHALFEPEQVCSHRLVRCCSEC